MRNGIPLFPGALTPTEVAAAMDLGAAAVKIFPAGRFGPPYLKDLRGPYPHIPLLPSGGINEDNAAEYLAAGALAVCAGTSVVPPAAVAAGDWAEITARASRFAAAIRLVQLTSLSLTHPHVWSSARCHRSSTGFSTARRDC